MAKYCHVSTQFTDTRVTAKGADALSGSSHKLTDNKPECCTAEVLQSLEASQTKRVG